MCAGLFLAGRLGPDRVPLHTEWRGLEGIGPAPVVKRIEDDLDLIVVVDVFAARHASAHLAGIVDAHEDGIEIFLVIAEVGIGGLGDTLSVVRVALGEAADLRHLEGDFSLWLHAEKIFQGGRPR
jgi:hypothetical protein